VPDDHSVVDGGLIDRPDNPLRNGYAFDGWYKEALFNNRWNFSADTVTKEVILYGKWSDPLQDKYRVRFIRDGGIPFPEDIAVNPGGKLTGVPGISKGGASFGGWFRDAACATEPWLFDDDTVTASIDLYAKWNQTNYYAVNFIANGGSPMPNQQVVALTGSVSTVAISRPGYAFGGWYSESAFENEWNFITGKVPSNLNLFAKWTANTLTITYDGGGGAGPAPESPKSAAYDTDVTMPANTYTFTHYTFDIGRASCRERVSFCV
jgi:uncharacterized repeat protein (TIGR02543 family)